MWLTSNIWGDLMQTFQVGYSTAMQEAGKYLDNTSETDVRPLQLIGHMKNSFPTHASLMYTKIYEDKFNANARLYNSCQEKMTKSLASSNGMAIQSDVKTEPENV